MYAEVNVAAIKCTKGLDYMVSCSATKKFAATVGQGNRKSTVDVNCVVFCGKLNLQCNSLCILDWLDNWCGLLG